MNTIARLPADRAPRMIDLTRHLPDLRSSLSPGGHGSGIQHPASSNQDLASSHEFTDGAKIIFAIFLVFFFGVIACYHLACAQ